MAHTPIYKTPLFLFYVALALLSCWPILTNSFFPTMDGAAHLYNSRLLHTFLFGDKLVTQYYSLNPELVPNWMGHLLQVVALSVGAKAYMAEKLVLLVIALGLPISFFLLSARLNKGKLSPNSILILPFVYTFTLGLGFFNFALGLVFWLLAFRQWLNWMERPTLPSALLVFFLVGCTYFSHVLPFVFLCLSVLVSFLFMSLTKKNRLVIALVGLLIFVPFLALFVEFYSSRSGADTSSYLAFKELVYLLINVRSLIMYNPSKEWGTTVFGAVMLLIFLVQFRFKTKEVKKMAPIVILVVTSVVLLFAVPDGNSGGSYVSHRISVLFFIFFALLLSVLPFKKVMLPFLTIYLITHFVLLGYYNKVIKDLNNMATQVHRASNNIEANASVLPITSSYNWLTGHFSNYLGVDKPVLILENYEASNDYFPLLWKDSILPNFNLGVEACSWWKKNPENETKLPDYVVLIGNKPLAPCDSNFFKAVEEKYIKLKHEEGAFAKLYRKK